MHNQDKIVRPAIAEVTARRLTPAFPRVLKANAMVRNKMQRVRTSLISRLFLTGSMIGIHEWFDVIEPLKYPPIGVSLKPVTTQQKRCVRKKEKK